MALDVADPQKAAKNKQVEMLMGFIGMLNVADELKDEELDSIGRIVADEYKIDKESRSDWEKQMEEAEKLVRMLMEKKTFPWDGASNAIYPLLSQAAIQFNSRSLPLMMKGQRVVKCRVNGPDPDGKKADSASLVSEHMSWQLMDEMDDWIGGKDAMLFALPVYGVAFQKVYRDIPNKRNASEYYNALDIVINYKARSMESAKRITHVFELSEREVIERQRAGLYLDADLGGGDQDAKSGDLREDEPTFVLLEQHRWLDLDEDDLLEPYIVTIHKDTEKVLRIRPRYDVRGIVLSADEKQIAKIDPLQYFVRYIFMPAPDGNIYGFGFGQLLLHPNAILNSMINQTIDSGTWYNTQAGIANPRLGLGRGDARFRPGEMKTSQNDVDDMRKDIMLLPAREPSQAIFQTLGLLLKAFEQLGSTTEVLAGESSTANQPASTTLALIEQGLKFYKATTGRLFKGLRDEYALLYDLNARHMSETEEQFFRLFEEEDRSITGAAYSQQSLDVTPVGASEEVTIVEKLIKAEQALQAAQQQGLPWKFMREVYLRYYEALGLEDIDEILPPADWEPPPDPKAANDAAELELKAKEQQSEDTQLGMELQKFPLEIAKLKLELVAMKEDIKNKRLSAEVNAAAKLADTETKRAKVEVDKKKAVADKKTQSTKPPKGKEKK